MVFAVDSDIDCDAVPVLGGQLGNSRWTVSSKSVVYVQLGDDAAFIWRDQSVWHEYPAPGAYVAVRVAYPTYVKAFALEYEVGQEPDHPPHGLLMSPDELYDSALAADMVIAMTAINTIAVRHVFTQPPPRSD